MTLILHNPVNRAQLTLTAPDPHGQPWVQAVVTTLVEALDREAISIADARAVFGAFRIPGFRFER